ncbi:MAG: hypothetical protein ACXADO_08945, partial [Candidatus Thorarchaeota archaeon]
TGLVIVVLFIPMIVPSLFLEVGLDQSVIWMTYIITILIALVLMAVTLTLAIKRFNRDTMIRMV